MDWGVFTNMNFSNMKFYVLSMIVRDGNAWLSGTMEKVKVYVHELKVIL